MREEDSHKPIKYAGLIVLAISIAIVLLSWLCGIIENIKL